MKAEEILETTADRFESGEYQWTQGLLAGPDGELCLVAGINKTGYSYWFEPFGFVTDETRANVNKAKEAVTSTLGTPLVGTWNDDPDRTLGEVIDVLKQAAKNLRNGEVK